MCLYFLFQSVHGGEARPETEVNSTQTNNSGVHREASPINALVKCTEAPRKMSEKDSNPRVRSSGWTCGECLQCFPERDLYVSHLKSKHGKVRNYLHSFAFCMHTFFSEHTYTQNCLFLSFNDISLNNRCNEFSPQAIMAR